MQVARAMHTTPGNFIFLESLLSIYAARSVSISPILIKLPPPVASSHAHANKVKNNVKTIILLQLLVYELLSE